MAGDQPDTSELLAFHYECIQGMYFSERVDTADGSLLFSDRVRDPYYNFLAPTTPIALTSCLRFVSEFERRKRQLAVYAVPGGEVVDDAPDGSFEVWARDAWLVGEVDRLDRDGPEVVGLRVGVIESGQREEYLATFHEAYSGDDPSDPYGQLDPAYTEVLGESFGNSPSGYRKYYVLARIQGQPVGVAALFTRHGLAGVYGVGTAPSRRRAGVGSAIMAYLTRLAHEDGARHMLLQTEADSAVQRWYEGLGYSVSFVAPYYVANG